jgi:nucleoside-diphosphate-sugar epimerase
MSKRVVITGATGFIGTSIVQEFLRSGNSVIVLTRKNSNLSRLSDHRANIKFIEYSTLDPEHFDISKVPEGADVFVHCAWGGVSGTARNEAFQITTNIPTTIHSVQLAAKLGCQQWIGLGSQAEYGNLNYKISENSANLPTTLYGKAKLASCISALGLCEAHQITGTWMRVFSTYGPQDAPNWFIPYVIQEFLANRAPKLTGCEQLWDYLYVQDAGRAVVAAASKKVNGIFNLGSGNALPLKSYIETIREVLGTSLIPEYGAIDYRPDQVMHLEADISKLTESTGWKPSVDLVDGLTQTVDFEISRKKNTA